MTMNRLRRQSILLTLLTSLLLDAGCASQRAYKDAAHEEEREHWDLAVLGYQKALMLEPGSARSRLGLVRSKQKAALAHFGRGRVHRAAGQLDLAQVELEQAAALDPTNESAASELKRVLAEIEARRLEVSGGTSVEKAKAKAKGARAKPPMLSPASDKPIDVTFPPDTNIKKIYQALSAAAGINAIFDPQLKDDKFSLDVRGMPFQKALETAMRQAGHFYKVLDEKTIIVAQDTNQNRKEYEDLVIRTFFLSNGDVKDVSAMVRSILDLRRMGTIPQLNAIIIRDTADKVAVAERIIEINDKAKSEVLIDVELLQLNTTRVVDIGTQLSAYTTVASPPGTTTPTTTTDGTTPAPVPTNSFKWADLLKLSLRDFSFAIPSIQFNFIKNNTDAELLARPQLRIAEGEKAQLVIGNRVPIPVTTVNTTQAIGQSGIVPITSFQYQDVGIKIDVEPRVHHNKEVSLKLTVEVSNLNGVVKGQNGQEQPIIGTRTITSHIRLKDGETNFLAGLIRTDESRSKTMLPFLGDLPIIGPLFSDTKTSRERNELFLTLTPHIIRAPQITEEDLIPIWVGTENNVSFSGVNTRLESPTAPGSPFDPGFDAQGQRPAPPTKAIPGDGEQKPSGPLPPSGQPVLLQGGGPNDPFLPKEKGSGGTPAVPKGVRALDTGGDGTASLLSLDAETPGLRPGESTLVSLSAPASLADLGALELTLEWDPSIVEVTGISPGPWKGTTEGWNVRFDADRSPGRARLQLGAPNGVTGLPGGVLARLMVRARAEGSTLFRVCAGAAFGKRGAVSPVTDPAAVTVAP